MDFEHCDDYELFLAEMAFGVNGEKLHELFLAVDASLEPSPTNLTDSEQLQEDMDDCWYNVWINPLTGIPHYVAANSPIPEFIPRADYNLSSTEVKPAYKVCTFCANKFGINSLRCKTHTVKTCRVLQNIECLRCKKKGHTASYCPEAKVNKEAYGKRNEVMSVLDKAGGIGIKVGA